MISLDHLFQATQIGESTDWEFKSAQGGFPKDFWETYSAMANTNGGTVVFGVKELLGYAELEGLSPEQLQAHQKRLWDELNNPKKVSRNLLSPCDVQVVPFGVKHLLAIRIPRAARTDGPIYLGSTPFQNTYRRFHEGDYRCSEPQVRRMLADSSSVPPDQRILRGFGIEDLDPASLEQYQKRFNFLRPNHPWQSLSLPEFLSMLGGWRKDREAGEEGMTLAALLMFGKHKPITDVGGAPSYFVDYREKLDWEVSWSHRIYPDGTWEPNLFQFYRRIWPHLSADLKVPFKLQGIERIDDTQVHKALREALVNAFIHSDYSAEGGVVVERYRDRFVIENPGTLLVSLEQLRRGGITECRNKALQTMFMMIGGGEKAGSGIHRIQSEWNHQHWRAPGFTVYDHPDRVRLVLPMVSLIPSGTLHSLQERFSDSFSTLKRLEVLALVTAELEGEVSNTRLQELETDHPTDITAALHELCLKGMLVSDFKRRWTRYRLPSKAGSEGFVLHDRGSYHFGDSSYHYDQSSYHNAAQRRLPPTAMRETILELCEGKYLEAAELAKLVQRSATNLRSRFLSPMVSEGLLELLHPSSPNRPDQAYTTKAPPPPTRARSARSDPRTYVRRSGGA